MHARNFAVALVTGAATLLGTTVAANLLLDPQCVFGIAPLSQQKSANYRYYRVRQYQAVRQGVDGLLFSSSRGRPFDAELLAGKMGVRAVAKFDVPFGFITDHLPALEYVLRDKASRAEPIHAVLLLLDADLFGEVPRTNVNTDSFLPPELTNESPARFWWRNLTFVQFRIWRDIISDGLGRIGRSSAGPAQGAALPRLALAGLRSPALSFVSAPQFMTIADQPQRGRLFSSRPNLSAQLDMIAKFAALCRAHASRLIVAIPPLRPDNAALYDPADLRNVVERVATVVPVWDFSTPNSVVGNPDDWEDRLHFKPLIAELMMERMFSATSSVPADFGTWRDRRPTQ